MSWNVPDGVSLSDPCAPWNEELPATCGECCHLLETVGECGVCERVFSLALAEARRGGMSADDAAMAALRRAADHAVSFDSEACESFSDGVIPQAQQGMW